MTPKDKEIPPVIVQSFSHREYYAVGALGGISKYDFRIGFYNKADTVEGEKGKGERVGYQIEATIIMPPQPYKELAIWAMRRYLEYEEKNGDLPLEENPLNNLINILEKLKKYDINDLKLKLAEIKKEKQKYKTKKE